MFTNFFYVNAVGSSSDNNTHNSVLRLSKSSGNNNNNTKDWNFYPANSHKSVALMDCSATNMVGPC